MRSLAIANVTMSRRGYTSAGSKTTRCTEKFGRRAASGFYRGPTDGPWRARNPNRTDVAAALLCPSVCAAFIYIYSPSKERTSGTGREEILGAEWRARVTVKRQLRERKKKMKTAKKMKKRGERRIFAKNDQAVRVGRGFRARFKEA